MYKLHIQSQLPFNGGRFQAYMWPRTVGAVESMFPYFWFAHWRYHRILYAKIVSIGRILSGLHFFFSSE